MRDTIVKRASGVAQPGISRNSDDAELSSTGFSVMALGKQGRSQQLCGAAGRWWRRSHQKLCAAASIFDRSSFDCTLALDVKTSEESNFLGADEERRKVLEPRGRNSLLAAIAAILIGVGAIATSVIFQRAENAFLATAVQTTATVIDKDRIRHPNPSRSDRFRLKYRYKIDGRTVTDTRTWTTSARAFNALHVGDSIEIAYRVGQDGRGHESRILDGVNRGFPIGPTMVGLVFVLAGIGLGMRVSRTR